MNIEVRCGNCDELILGRANRCWRCGRAFPATATWWPTPPIREEPADDKTPLLAEVLDDESGTSAPSDTRESGIPAAKQPTDVTNHPSANRWMSRRPVLAASVSLTLGLLSFLLSFQLPAWAAATAVGGLGAGVLALGGKRPAVGLFALLICCVALTISGFLLAVTLYSHLHGIRPWDCFEPRPVAS